MIICWFQLRNLSGFVLARGIINKKSKNIFRILKTFRVVIFFSCWNSVSVAVESKTSKIDEIIFIRTKMMAESLYFAGRQFIKQGCLGQKFGVILHHWTVLWFFIENKVRICWFQLRNLHKIIFIRTKIMVESVYLSLQTVCWSRWPMTNFWWSTFS